jgi:predicted transcriptional regulator
LEPASPDIAGHWRDRRGDDIQRRSLIYDTDIIYHPARRTLIDIPDSQVRALAAVSERTKQPRAAIVRAAIAEYLAHHAWDPGADAFGLWGTDAQDGLAYQHRLRDEW